MFNFIKEKLQKIYSTVTQTLQGLFTQQKIDAETLEKLRELLITADAGVKTTQIII